MKQLYKNVGIGVLIASFLLLGDNFFFFINAWISIPNFFTYMIQSVFGSGVYIGVLTYSFLVVETLLCIWGIVLSIMLTMRNKYNKQLLWWVYSIVAVKVLIFVLYLPLVTLQTLYSTGGMFVDMGIALFVFWSLIRKDNELSRIIKGK